MLDEDVQSYVGGLLAAVPEFAAAGMVVYDPSAPNDGSGILLDDGADPKTPGREGALRTQGIVLTVLPVGHGDVVAQDREGTTQSTFVVTIYGEEDVLQNRSADGSNIRLEKVMRLVREWVSGRPQGSNQVLIHSRTSNMDFEDGVRAQAIEFTLTNVSTPVFA